MHSHIVFTLVTAMFMQYNPAYTFRTTKFSWLLHLGSAVSLKCPIDNYMYYSPTEYVVIPQRSCFICCDYRAEIAIKKSIRKWEKCAKKKLTLNFIALLARHQNPRNERAWHNCKHHHHYRHQSCHCPIFARIHTHDCARTHCCTGFRLCHNQSYSI